MNEFHPDLTRMYLNTHPLDNLINGDIYVFSIRVNKSSPSVEQFPTYLHAEEISRSRSFKNDDDRIRNTTARCFLRLLLSSYCGLNNSEIIIKNYQKGKPYFSNAHKIEFNLSHSGDLVLVALSAGIKLGVDIEQIINKKEVLDIAENFFSKAEIEILEELRPGDLVPSFYKFWARKEAYIKAIGEGISFPLKLIDVSDISTSLTGAEGSVDIIIKDLSTAPGYKSAIALEGNNRNILEYDVSEMFYSIF